MNKITKIVLSSSLLFSGVYAKPGGGHVYNEIKEVYITVSPSGMIPADGISKATVTIYAEDYHNLPIDGNITLGTQESYDGAIITAKNPAHPLNNGKYVFYVTSNEAKSISIPMTISAMMVDYHGEISTKEESTPVIKFGTENPVLTFDTGHPYTNNQHTEQNLSIAGAETLTVTIEGETEKNYDFIKITKADGTETRYDGNINESFEVVGDHIKVNFDSDYSVTKSGATVTISQ